MPSVFDVICIMTIQFNIPNNIGSNDIDCKKRGLNVRYAKNKNKFLIMVCVHKFCQKTSDEWIIHFFSKMKITIRMPINNGNIMRGTHGAEAYRGHPPSVPAARSGGRRGWLGPGVGKMFLDMISVLREKQNIMFWGWEQKIRQSKMYSFI